MLFYLLSLPSLAASQFGVAAGGVINDPFVKRRTVQGTYLHRADGFGVLARAGYAPDLGDDDWKPLTKQIVEENSVSPDISKLTTYGSAQLMIPLTTIADDGNRVQMFVSGGMGMVQTADDLKALDAEDDPRAQSTQYQWHPTVNWGLMVQRTNLKEGLFDFPADVFVSGESMAYVETVNATTLEMKSNFLVSVGVLFGGGR